MFTTHYSVGARIGAGFLFLFLSTVYSYLIVRQAQVGIWRLTLSLPLLVSCCFVGPLLYVPESEVNIAMTMCFYSGAFQFRLLSFCFGHGLAERAKNFTVFAYTMIVPISLNPYSIFNDSKPQRSNGDDTHTPTNEGPQQSVKPKNTEPPTAELKHRKLPVADATGDNHLGRAVGGMGVDKKQTEPDVRALLFWFHVKQVYLLGAGCLYWYVQERLGWVVQYALIAHCQMAATTAHYAIWELITAMIFGWSPTTAYSGLHSTTTLGEFWGKSWNMAIAENFRHGVYLPIVSVLMKNNGVAKPTFKQRGVGVFATFIASGLWHEQMIYWAMGTATGEQFVFFVLQGLLVVLEGVTILRGIALRGWLGVACTYGVLLATAPLFFEPYLKLGLVDRVFMEYIDMLKV